MIKLVHLLLLPGLALGQSNCPVSNGWQEVVGIGCYLLDTSFFADWMACAAECQVQGGHLVEIETQAEQDALLELTSVYESKYCENKEL